MTGQVGPRGLAILVLAGITGLLLAILGWSQRGTGLVAPTVGGLGGSAPARTAPSSTAPSSTAPASTSAPPSATASAQPSSAPTPSLSALPSAQTSIGPLLSAEPYAQFAYLVWPGTLSTAARDAMSGLTINVTRRTGGISVQAGQTGYPLPPARFYPEGGKVYVIEAGLGDDSGSLDYNMGDDGLVVTTVQGRVVQ
jgi:hypothetical protein